MLLRYVLTSLEDLFVDPAANVGPMLTRISLAGEDLLTLPVREFINFQPALGSVALDASIFRRK